MQGEGGEWRARVRSGGGLSAGAAGLEFPSKRIIRREFFGNNDGYVHSSVLLTQTETYGGPGAP